MPGERDVKGVSGALDRLTKMRVAGISIPWGDTTAEVDRLTGAIGQYARSLVLWPVDKRSAWIEGMSRDRSVVGRLTRPRSTGLQPHLLPVDQ